MLAFAGYSDNSALLAVVATRWFGVMEAEIIDAAEVIA